MQIRMVHSGRDRDSLLMPMGAAQNMDLMLQYTIQLVRCEPTTHFRVAETYCTGNGIMHDEYGTFHLDQWTDGEWNEFRNNISTTILRYWDDKFELTPNQAWHRPFGPQRPAEATPITCSLSLGLVDQPNGAHQKYYIVKPRETSFRSFAVPDQRKGLFTNRDLSYNWITRRTRIGHVRHSVSFLQCTILHEFGHTLGLGHVAGDGNDDAAYGTTLEQREDLMGMGDNVGVREANPWKTQLRHHLISQHTREDAALRFTARVVAPQLITYWDNDWTPPPAAP